MKSKSKTFTLIFLSLISLVPFVFMWANPIYFIQNKYPEFKNWLGSYTKSISIQRDGLDSYVVYSVDPCSGVTCAYITCFKVNLWNAQKIGNAHGYLWKKSDIDFRNCKINDSLKQ